MNILTFLYKLGRSENFSLTERQIQICRDEDIALYLVIKWFSGATGIHGSSPV